MTADYRVKFLRDFTVETAPPLGQSGMIMNVIPAGTEKTISEHSLKFYRDREAPGKPIVEVLGKVRETDQGNPAPGRTEQPLPPAPPASTLPTKTQIRELAEGAQKLLEGDLRETAPTLLEALELLLASVVAEVLGMGRDTSDVLEAAREDLRLGPVLHAPQEVADALAQVLYLTLPPSKRRNKS